MRKLIETIFYAGCCLVGTCASGTELSCQRAPDETAALSQAPSGVRRIGKHVLQVRVKTGRLRYEDRAPHEPLSGLHWRYCGYDARARIHLIEMQKDSLFSGLLVFEDTGKVLQGGHTVLFAPDHHAYLAVEQTDGMDGESWSLRDAGGSIEWTGYAGTVKRIGGIDTVASTFEQPRWSARNELTARLVCADSKVNALITLRRSGKGWNWLGQPECGP